MGLAAVHRNSAGASKQPGEWAGAIFFVAIAVGISGQVEPMSSPTFAKVRGTEKVFDELLVSVGAGVRNEAPDLIGSRGETDKIEIETADECGFVRFARGLEAFFLETGEDEIIDGIANPAFVPDNRNGCTNGTLEGPVGRL